LVRLLILLDIRMPGMDGLEVLRQVRKFDKDVGIIMLTSIIARTLWMKHSEWVQMIIYQSLFKSHFWNRESFLILWQKK
jgi:two-component SAPR family response regulator